MDLSQLLRERLVVFVSNGNQSVYKRIIELFEDLQWFYQELVRTAESGVHENPKTFEKALEGIKNEILESMKYVLKTFMNIHTSYNEIMKPRGCIINHIKDIEVQTKVDLQVIICHIQNAMDECIKTKNNINKIVTNHHRITCTNKTTNNEWYSSLKSSTTKIIGEQLEYQNAYYEDIINELKNTILSAQEENQKTFTAFSQVASNVMSLQMKCDCIQTVDETCSKMYIKISNFKEICLQTAKNLDTKIKNCESNFSLTKEKCTLLISDWETFQVISDEILLSITEQINQFNKMSKSLDKCVLQKNKELKDLNSEYQIICQSEKKINKNMVSSEAILENLGSTLSVLEEKKNSYKIETVKQDTDEKKLLSSIKDLDEKIDELKNKIKHVEFDAVDDDYHISNYTSDFDLESSEQLKSSILMYEEITKKVNELDIEKNELQWLGDTYVDRLKWEDKEKEENQKNVMRSEINDRRLQLLDLSNKEMENIKVKIPRCKELFMESVHMNNGLDNCIKVLLIGLQNMMINNHGKTMEKLIQEREEMSAANIIYADSLRNLRSTDTGQMEALLEERIQLLQDRMKAISAQREQIEQANKGLEEELDKLSKKFVKMENNVKGQAADETEEVK